MSAEVQFCDDCGGIYLGAPYYSIDEDNCSEDSDPDHVCTTSICPECAGVWLVPDDPNDPRRPRLPDGN